MEKNTVLVRHESLQNYIMGIFNKVGMTEKMSKLISNSLIEADLRGTSSHGVMRIPIYMKRIKAGLISTDEKIDTIRDFASTSVLDANNTVGQYSGTIAMHRAIEKAKVTGIGCVGVRNSNHYGTAGYYAELAAKENMIGIAMTNTTPLVAVYGGKSRAVGNNPIAIAIPAKENFPIVLDMACSVAQGKIELAAKQGKTIPLDWATDENGQPTTDPNKALQGFLLPIAGPKGSGLAISIDILCGILNGAASGNHVMHLNNMEETQKIGNLFIAIDITKFANLEEFLSQVDDYITQIKSGPKSGDSILMPGEFEFITKKQRQINGIPLPNAVVSDLEELALSYGIEAKLKIESIR